MLRETIYKRDTRAGFTLMEIMVVVVIIAVLASVGGPMIGDLIDQGKISATKSKMATLKSGIIAYKNDVSRFPRKKPSGKATKQGADTEYKQANVLGDDFDSNVLVNDAVVTGYGANPAEADDQYGKGNKKWKGPYMDSDPADFMFDSWGNRIRYYAVDHELILWSSGPDNQFNSSNADTISKLKSNISADDGGEDDIILSVARFRGAFSSDTCANYEVINPSSSSSSGGGGAGTP